jgi:peptidoglycan-associated lipoprotein
MQSTLSSKESYPMRPILVPLAILGLVFAGCRKSEPEVAPPPVVQPPPPPPVAPPPPPGTNEAACLAAIEAVVSDVARMIHFDTDKFDIRPGDAAILDAKAAVLRTHGDLRLRLVGHADERYTEEYNFVLGTRRAEAAKDYLVRRGIDAGRLTTASMGETQPLDPRSNEEAWARNRRVEFEITGGRDAIRSRLAPCQ